MTTFQPDDFHCPESCLCSICKNDDVCTDACAEYKQMCTDACAEYKQMVGGCKFNETEQSR